MRARRAYRLSLVILGLASLVNVIVAIRVLVALRSPVSYHFRVVEPPIITNVVTSALVDLSLPGTPVDEPVYSVSVSTNSPVSFDSCISNRVEIAVDQYHFMRVNDFPCIRLNGQTYSVGDVCAYGRIISIFPERVYFDDGSYLSNSRRVFDLVDFQKVNYQSTNINKDSEDERKRSSDS